jgi:hypothetical protein
VLKGLMLHATGSFKAAPQSHSGEANHGLASNAVITYHAYVLMR